MPRRPSARGLLLLAVAAVGPAVGCAGRQVIVPAANMPKELTKVTMPEYMIEPPDVLQIDLISAIPKPPYKLQPLDAIGLRVPEAPMTDPIAGVFPIELDGTISLGGSYGTVAIGGLTIPEAKAAIEAALDKVLRNAKADITLAQGRGLQQVRGPYLVRPDGAVGLGTYGSVRLVGLTVPQAKAALEQYLSTYFQNPEISLAVTGYNSKVFYVIFDTGGIGQTVLRQPVTGNETVLDVISNSGGLPGFGNPRTMWIARPAPDSVASATGDCSKCQNLPIDWKAITECGDVRTNYQVLPGDRLFVKAYRSNIFLNTLERYVAPFERLSGVTLLGLGTIRAFQNNGGGNGLGGFGGGF